MYQTNVRPVLLLNHRSPSAGDGGAVGELMTVGGAGTHASIERGAGRTRLLSSTPSNRSRRSRLGDDCLCQRDAVDHLVTVNLQTAQQGTEGKLGPQCLDLADL